MSKYTRLDNSENATTTTTSTSTLTRVAAAEEDDNDDDDDNDESYPMFVAHDHNNSNSNNNKHANSSRSINNYKRTASVNNNNNSNHSNNYLIDHENTMEVPLLNGTNNNNNNTSNNHHHTDNFTDFEWQQLHHCRCKQPGFAASTKDKSTQEAKIKIILAISLCVVFMIVEFLGGYLAGSLAIMTDAAHLASDCISFVIGLVSIWLGSRLPDAKMSFGYKRTEVMGALVSIFSIWILTATLVMVAIQRLYSNDYDLDSETMMIISGIGILINIVMAHILHGSSLLPAGGAAHGHSHAHGHAHTHASNTNLTDIQTHTHTQIDDALIFDGNEANGSDLLHTNSSGHQEKNLNLRAAMIHVIGDLVQSVGVFLAAIVIKFYPGAKFMDPLCTILFSFIVLLTTVGLFKESVRILSDAVPSEVSIASLEIDLAHIEGVKSVHHLNVWNHTSDFSVMMVHLVIDLLSDSNTVLNSASKLARKTYKIKHSTIQIERLPS